MSIDALVAHVGQVLNRAHALFGQPGTGGGVAAGHSGAALGGAAELVRHSHHRMSGLSGVLPATYSTFATDAAPGLVKASTADNRLGTQIHDAVQVDWTGRANSGSVVNGAAADTSTLAPVSGTPAGQRALIATLRARLAQQQHLVNEYTVRDARLAAMMRSLSYGRGRRGGGGMPSGAMPFGSGGGGFGGGGGGGSSGLGGLISPVAALGRGAGSRSGTPSGLRAPQGAVGIPLGALTLDSSPREVASAIVHEAQRRGYSPYQTTAILADAMQESNLNPRAKSPNGLWEDVFQQDASYPGRRNPNLAISEFFNRLDHHGGPGSPDIWKSIFWLQQRPGEPSAAQAYSHGRQGYLTEIMGKHQKAMALYRDIVGGGGVMV
ncbi:hypothetical protein OK015_28685 (plasmid) [Mycobacterium sp. Aquia_216]|uniref:hypothetical protein n=1 Tax=Mycobacterium sp. Aquia_216 TaxID=2991729 RepID=UPI00227CA149|nr:hypothetical protein [Mycobacterium sp. Aquia_216]WAJ48027.1 hypothetical protein OK015_28685 [Mycobacterium sp. Aquia_216]